MGQDIRQIEPVREFLVDTAIFGYLRGLITTHQLQEDRLDELLDVTDAVIKGVIPPDQMLPLVQQAFGLTEEKAKMVSADLAGYRLLPLVEYIPGIKETIIAWGGKVEDYPELRVAKPQKGAKTSMDELAEKIGLSLPDHLMNRLAYLAKGYLTKQRAKEATIELMKRRMNIGGLELTAEQAENVIALLEKEAESFEFVSEKKEDSPKKTEVAMKATDGPAAERELSFRKANQKQNIASLPTKSEIASSIKVEEKDEVQVVAKKASDVSKPVIEQVEQPKTNIIKKKKVEKKKVQVDPNQINDILRPVSKVFRKKHIPRRAYTASVGAFVRGEEDMQDLMTTFTEYSFSKQEIDLLLPVIKKARALTLGEKYIEPQEDVKSLIKTSSLPAKAITHALTKEVPVISGSVLEDHEVKEVETHAKAAKKVEHSLQGKSKEEVETKVNEALAPAITVFKKKRIAKKKFEEVAKAHIRGIREVLQTERLLKEKFNLEGDDLTVVSRAFESARKIAHGESVVSAAVSVGEKNAAKISEGKGLEADVLEKRHIEITKKVPAKKIKPVAPNARVSAARTKEEELKIQEEKIDEQIIKEAQLQARPKPAKAKLSRPSVPPGDKKKVVDVKFARRLVGPVEELSMMKVSNFRRLSTDPAQAVKKIEDRLELLEVTAYSERVKGVKAWRNSPVNKLYLKMMNESLLKGASISEIATSRRNAGEESLSPAEIAAIVGLNNRIKF